MANTNYETASRLFAKELVEPARMITEARKFFGKTVQLPKGKVSMEFDQLKEMGAAMISHTMPTGHMVDAMGSKPVTVKVPFFWKDYQIDRQKFDAFKGDGKDIERFNLQGALYQLNLREESTLILGWAPDGSTYSEGVLGLFQAAANSSTAVGTTGTFGNALATVTGLLSMLDTDNISGVNFNLIMNFTQWQTLMSSISYGQRETELILPLLNRLEGMPKGGIISHKSMATGTAMIVPVDPLGTYIQLLKSYDYTVDVGIDSRSPQTSPIFVKIFEGLAPFYPQVDSSGQTNAIAKISGGM